MREVGDREPSKEGGGCDKWPMEGGEANGGGMGKWAHRGGACCHRKLPGALIPRVHLLTY